MSKYHLEARKAGGFSKHASLYGKDWERMADGEGADLVMEKGDAEFCMSESKAFDKADGVGEHTQYRIVEVA